MMKIQKIKGFADLFPEEAAKFTFLESRAREIFGRYGFGELRTPLLEHTELFAKSIGEDTDVVGKEMFTFPDRKGRLLTLRPEATAGVMRAFIEGGDWQPGQVRKYFTTGPMFRYERPQKGRQRQFHQINAEILGANEPQADAELILMLRTFLTDIGLTRLSVELNTLGCRECRPLFRQALTAFFAGLDREKLCEDCRRRVETNPLRVLDCKVPGCRELTKDAPHITDHVCGHCREHFDTVKALLDAARVAYTLNPRLVRGLDYYQRTAFEITSGEIGAQTAVAGGGRYDGLVGSLGGPDVPGVGFACGMERLTMLLEHCPESRPDFHLAVLDERAVNQALILAQGLRERGLSGEVAYAPGSLKSQLRRANKSGARLALVIGSEEFEKGLVLIKDMGGAAEQRHVPRERLLAMTAVSGLEALLSAALPERTEE
ncbi:histidine--tRNA ligase [Desulfovibrio aminophilus]|uniref:histidine--tRNA ligase n=1 Tax=Desulfovibrio aminophilus TaxID=81425 RepID=UPI003394F1D5